MDELTSTGLRGMTDLNEILDRANNLENGTLYCKKTSYPTKTSLFEKARKVVCALIASIAHWIMSLFCHDQEESVMEEIDDSLSTRDNTNNSQSSCSSLRDSHDYSDDQTKSALLLLHSDILEEDEDDSIESLETTPLKKLAHGAGAALGGLRNIIVEKKEEFQRGGENAILIRREVEKIRQNRPEAKSDMDAAAEILRNFQQRWPSSHIPAF